jgi:hypothetical protein
LKPEIVPVYNGYSASETMKYVKNLAYGKESYQYWMWDFLQKLSFTSQSFRINDDFKKSTDFGELR